MKRVFAAFNIAVFSVAAIAFGPALVRQTRSAACSAVHLGCTSHGHVVVRFTRLS